MSLLTYEQARPWARAIKTAVASRKMPPWFADPGLRALRQRAPAERRERSRRSARWVDAGAPAGNESERRRRSTFENGWNITPDIVVEMPKPFEMPAAAPSTTSTWS